MRVGGVLLVAVLLAVALAEPAPDFARDAESYLDDHCLACHTGKRAKGGVDLRGFEKARPELRRRVERVVRNGEMPPEDEERPDAAATRRFLAWLHASRSSQPLVPGRVTLRRLNRHEYAHTVRDLLGVDFDPARLPADDVGYGFDNIGDVLSLPPALLERYFDVAESIARRAVVSRESHRPKTERVEGAKLRAVGGGNVRRDGVHLYSNGAARAAFRLPRAGEYLIRVRAWGQQAGPEPCKTEARVGTRRLGVQPVTAVRAEPEVVEWRARLKGGRQTVDAAFTNDYYQPRHPDPKQRDRNFFVAWIEVEGPIDRPRIPPSQERLVPAGATELRPLVARLATRAFRRPVGARDLDALLAAVARAAPESASIERRMQLAITAMLVSPRFLFRLELDPRARELDDWELASRLSYFLWSSMPDAALFARAAKGELRDPDVLRAEVSRMLRDPRASSLAEHFATQWLRVRDLERHESVDPALRAAMRAETVLFFDAILREGRDVRELLVSDFTFVNDRLAKHYGLPGVRGPHMRRVRLEGNERGGVLTQGSVLLSTSNPTRTSPVRRGKWVLDALLDDAPPPPPPGFDSLDESAKAKAQLSLRARLEQHRADPNCAVCHRRMDVLGFALEHYGRDGRWRTRDGKFAIDASGTLPDGTRVQGAGDLKRLLHADPRFRRAFAKHLTTYALGRGLDDADEPLLESILAAWERPTIGRLVTAIVLSPAFRQQGDA
ncbi:MAG: DUF1592 domain-containing protein [Planctomycetota bacterium]